MARATNRGVLYVHSSPSALCPHLEWAAAGVLGVRVDLEWAPQPVAPGQYRAEFSWQGEPGTAAKLASALRGWNRIRYEVTEDAFAGTEGERYSCTPDLGIFHATIGAHGDILIPEDRLRAAMARATLERGELADEVDRLLGGPWDAELEPFRHAGEDSGVRWLHQVV